ncbi:ribosomal protein L22/L17 [Schizothecium vesticola]|uniref:Ribosomal protein L22/L17 n=1 Tax=Schizothecium vesticola TaxID=314040 RepID=A0AA40F5H5_9PEZI|nr:ribosomal protein L22/L17 [Schizothecium vesticola]
MSLSLPSRRLLRSASTLPTTLPLSRALSTTPSRPWFWSKKNSDPAVPAGPFGESLTGSAADRAAVKERLKSSSRRRQELQDDFKKTTTERLQTPAMFDDVVEAPQNNQQQSQPKPQPAARDPNAPWTTSQVREHYARAVDPDPRSRVRWERKMVIRRVHAGTDAFSREPRAARLKRTERESRMASPWLPTSVKKLVMLARQVAGKPVDEALTQMRYSKKKMAAEVRVELEKAMELAVVARGMGLGAADKAGKKREPVRIKTKDGKWIDVADPTKVYIAEAFVNRGPWRFKRLVPGSRGRSSLHYSPATSINFVLKEEKTRIREHQEREAKAYRKGPWIPHPDRPVTAQRQHYSW